jgi:hypothetical protein
MGEADWVAEITDRIADSPLSCNAWTVGCHNSQLGLQNPDLTIESPAGDSLPFGLCPSQPAMQSYLMTLVGELDDRPFDRIELETFNYFFGSGLGWHHDKVFVELGGLGTFLLGLCFCDECRANAVNDGVDVSAARETCVQTIDAIAAGDLPATLEPLEWLRAHPGVADYVAVRERTLVDLYAQLRETVDAELGYYVGVLDVARSGSSGRICPRWRSISTTSPLPPTSPRDGRQRTASGPPTTSLPGSPSRGAPARTAGRRRRGQRA